MDNKYHTNVTHQTIQNIIMMTESTEEGDKIDLNAPYQRDVVWDTERKSFFINSVLIGITPNNILYNQDKESGNMICMDGKQRITSLVEFKNNKIPVIFEDDEKTDQLSYAYYDKLPDKYKDDNKYRILTQQERNFFNKSSIPTVTYSNLEYIDQVKIFNRIQHGKVLTTGEKMIALFINEKVSVFFKDLCNSRKELFEKFKMNVTRQDHIPKIILIMYMISKNKLQKPSKNTILQKYIEKLDTLVKIKKETANLDKLINVYFGKNILGHHSISCDLYADIILSGVFLLHNLFDKKLDKITDAQCSKFRSALRKTYRDIKAGSLDHKRHSGVIGHRCASLAYRTLHASCRLRSVVGTALGSWFVCD